MAYDWFLLLIPQSFGLDMASYPLMMWITALYKAWNDLNALNCHYQLISPMFASGIGVQIIFSGCVYGTSPLAHMMMPYLTALNYPVYLELM